MCTKAVCITLAVVSIAAVAQAQVRVNEVAPGRGQEILKMQTVPQVTLPPEPTNPNPHPYPVEPTYPWVGYYPYHYGGYGYPYYNNGSYYNSGNPAVVVVPMQNAQGSTPTVATPREPTQLDYAMEAVQRRKTSIAIDRFLEHLKINSDDAVAIRVLGLMYLEEKQPSEAAARIASAYKSMPELARRPLSVSELRLDMNRMHDLVVRASKYANRIKTGSSWLMVTVLAQAEGRTNVALANLAKAEAAGLDAQTVAALRNALAPMETEQIPVAAPLKDGKDAPALPSTGDQKSNANNPKNP